MSLHAQQVHNCTTVVETTWIALKYSVCCDKKYFFTHFHRMQHQHFWCKCLNCNSQDPKHNMKKEKPGRTYYILFIYVHLHKLHANPTKSRVIPKNQEVCRLGHKRGNCLKRLYLDPQILLVHANTIKPKGYVTWRVKKRLTKKGLFWGQDILKHPIFIYIYILQVCICIFVK